MKYLRKKITTRLLIIAVSACFLTAYLLLVDPTNGGLLTILVPIMFAWAMLFLMTQTVLESVLRNTRHTVIRFVSATVTSSSLFFLLLSGIGTISIVDILLTTSLVVIMGFYVSRLWK